MSLIASKDVGPVSRSISEAIFQSIHREKVLCYTRRTILCYIVLY